jgi:hypothetical protein
MPVLKGAWTHDCCPDLPHVKAAQNSKIFQNCNLLHPSFIIKVNRILEQKMQDRNPGVEVWSCGHGRKFFPEREYVHSGQAWLWSFPNMSKECHAGPGESVMTEHRATKQKVYTF